MSKSVKERMKAPITGTKKKTQIRRRAGVRKSHGVDWRVSIALSRPRTQRRAALRQDPAPLLEQKVDVAVQGGECRVACHRPSHDRLRIVLHLRRNLLPLRHLRKRTDALQLIVERE